MDVIRLTADHPEYYFKEAARIHIETIVGVLPLLGEKFLTRLYIELNKIPNTGVWGAIEDSHFIGFVAGAANVEKSYLSVLKNAVFPLAWMSLPALIKPAILKEAIGVLTYPFRQKNINANMKQPSLPNPHAELLAIAVDKKAQGGGIGRQLVKALEAGFRSWGLSGAYYVSTNLDDPNSNAFYQRLGFVQCGQMPLHKSKVQIYKKNI